MYLSPVENFNSFIKNRPPLILFSICIICLAITTFSFAFYIDRTIRITDTDILLNWYQLKMYFNDLDVCINKYPIEESLNERDVLLLEEEPIWTFGKIVYLNNLQNFTDVNGLLTLEGFSMNCADDSYVPKSLKIRFNISDVQPDSKICMQISGPKKFMPKFSEFPCTSDMRLDESGSGFLISEKHILNRNFCDNGTKIKFDFDIKENGDNFAIFLETDDRRRIYNHLMWCSYILVGITFIILLYAILRRSKNLNSNNY